MGRETVYKMAVVMATLSLSAGHCANTSAPSLLFAEGVGSAPAWLASPRVALLQLPRMSPLTVLSPNGAPGSPLAALIPPPFTRIPTVIVPEPGPQSTDVLDMDVTGDAATGSGDLIPTAGHVEALRQGVSTLSLKDQKVGAAGASSTASLSD